jgi:hypothetical protein
MDTMRRARIGGIGVLAALAALAAGCGDITAETDGVDSGPAGVGGHVMARLDSGAGGAAPAGVGGETGTGGRLGTGGAPAAGVGGAATTGTGGRPAGIGGSPGTAGAGDIPECPLTGNPAYATPCPADSYCNQLYSTTPIHHRCSICNTPPYPPGYDLSVLPCLGGYLCVKSCENP